MVDTTVVIFRKFITGDVIALFPELEHNRSRYEFVSYMHIGQHGCATTDIPKMTYPASEAEYASLKAELESIGYNLRVKTRIMYYDLFYSGCH